MTAFVAAALASGLVTTMAWLGGQVFPRAALPIAFSVFALAVASLWAPQILTFVPWGWVGATYPPSRAFLLPLAGALAFAATLIAVAPTLLNRLTGMQLHAQAATWQQTLSLSSTFDFRAASAAYETKPRFGRTIRAVHPSKHRWWTFLMRDVVGQVRTPTRSLGAIITTATAGMLLTFSLIPGLPSALMAALAGGLQYVATGPLAKGLEHAGTAAGQYPIYGISDWRLALLHTLFPFVAIMIILPASAMGTALATGATIGTAVAGACAIGILALALRFSSSLKGALPAGLLTPMSTPVGDLSIVMQLGWAFSDPLIAILGAFLIAALPDTAIALALLAIWTAALIVTRWRKRR